MVFRPGQRVNKLSRIQSLASLYRQYTLTYVELVPKKVLVSFLLPKHLESWAFDIPFVVDGLNDKPQCWADRIDVLVHDLLDYSCFARIVKASAFRQLSFPSSLFPAKLVSYSIKILSSLSLRRAFRRIDSILGRKGMGLRKDDMSILLRIRRHSRNSTEPSLGSRL